MVQLQVCKLVRKIRVVELGLLLRLRDRVRVRAPERDASDEEESPVALTVTAIHDGIVPFIKSAVVDNGGAPRCYACAAEKCVS